MSEQAEEFTGYKTVSEFKEAYKHMSRTCRGKLSDSHRKLRDDALKAGDLEAAKKHDNVGRKHCGQELNALILDLPCDGNSHKLTCPKCGLVSEHKNPLIVEVQSDTSDVQTSNT